MDYKLLEKALAEMKPRQQLYELIKKEMVKRGRWKTASRGSVFSKGYDPRRKTTKP